MNYWQQIKPRLRKVRDGIVGEEWKYQIKPITWYNFPSWIAQTIAEDRKFYQPKQRSLSLSQITKAISPNLKQPVFIIGSPRSVTTFLGKCIQQLPEVSYHFEPVLTKASVRYIHTKQWSGKNAAKFYRSVYGWLMRQCGDSDLRFVEKTPRNSFIIPFLAQTFPDAKFIHIIRDGRDVAMSLSKCPWYRKDRNGCGAKDPGGYPFGSMARFWVESDRTKEFETTNDLHRCIWIWRRYVDSAFIGAKSLPRSQYYQLTYEDLVRDPTLASQKILDFIEIDNLQSRSKFSEYAANTAKSSSVGSWKKLSPDLLKELELEAGDWLSKLGYQTKSYTITGDRSL